MKFKRPHATSLAQRFMLGVIPVSLAGIILLGVSAFYVTKIYITRNVEKEIKVFSQGAASSVAGFFRQRQNDLETLSETSLLADYYNNADYGLKEEAEQYRRELERYFLRFYERTGGDVRITYVNSKRREVCGTEGSKNIAGGQYFKSEEIFNTAAAGKKNIFRFPISDDPLYGPKITYAKPVFDAAGGFRGIIVLEAGLKTLQDTLSRLRVGSNGRTYITDASNRPVLAGTGSQESAPLSPSDFISRLPIEDTDLWVMVTAPRSDFQAPLRTISRFTILLVAVCGALAAFFIFFTIRGMTRPLKKLVEATRRLAEGRAFEKVVISNRDEIGILADSFNIMGSQLTDRTAELKSRIKELLVLQGMSAAVIKKLDEDHICRVCLEAAVAGLGFERGVLYLINKERTQIAGRYVHSTQKAGFTEEQMRTRIIPLDSGDILAEVVRTRKGVNVREPLENPGVNRHFVEEVGTKAFCLVPVMTEQKVLGVIGADNYYSGKRITDEQMNDLMLFGAFTALALENAHLVSDVRMSEERYRTVLDNSPDAIVGLDASFHVTVWNRGAQTLFGYLAGEMIGQPVSKLFTPSTAELVMLRVEKTGFFSGTCMEGVTSLGKKLELDITWAGSERWKSSENEWTVVIRDTSEQRKLQAQLIQAEKLSAVGKLISGVAHELNNPLTGIMCFSELLLEERLGESADSKLRKINDASHRCKKIIENLLTFARWKRPEKRYDDINRIIKDSVEFRSYQLSMDNIELMLDLGAAVPGTMVDASQIQQVFLNLINNASDAIREKGPSGRIEIASRFAAGKIVVSITDTGKGFSEEVANRLFDPFFTTKDVGKGTGLGLSISYGIINEHGGNIYASSRPRIGTTFVVELPVLEEDALSFNACCASERKKRVSVDGMRALVLDDEEIVLDLLADSLTGFGFEVDKCSSAEDALKKISESCYDLIISDIKMPGLGGKGFYREVEKINPGVLKKIIFISGDSMGSETQEFLEAIGNPSLKKPFSIDELSEAVARMVL
ncbi:MAG TPA: hypothetical protein DEF68_09860 [Elusimicrobia bacterium]|nr:hypothetical protein [Elusimicrobiota bacterium]